MEKLSVAIITLNEERNIERCLASVTGLADEIIVVDSLSTDKTREICDKYHVQFSTHPFAGYIEQKIEALNRCNHKFVLSLDADEALSEELKTSILQEKAKGFSGIYSFNRLTNYCGQWIKHCGWYPDVKLRLFDKTIAFWGGNNPHDKLILKDKKSRIKHLNGDLFHYSYYTVDEHYKQANRFADIASKTLFEKEKKSSIPYAVLKTVAKFTRNYIFKLGFLDGRFGFTICKISALETWWKYTRVITLNKQKRSESDV